MNQPPTIKSRSIVCTANNSHNSSIDENVTALHHGDEQGGEMMALRRSWRGSLIPSSAWADRLQSRCPRLFNTVFVIIIPLLVLLIWAVICGHFLTLIENEGELVSNNALVAATYRGLSQSQRQTVEMAQRKHEDCLNEYIDSQNPSEMINSTELKAFMNNCTSNVLEVSQIVKREHFRDITSVKLNWNTCREDGKRTLPIEQRRIFVARWIASFNAVYNESLDEAVDQWEAFDLALEKADGSDSCIRHTAGGAFFWFTTMTTIGYGNAVPVTVGGRVLVMTLGFLSILSFTAVIGYIAYVTLALIDDYFERKNLFRLKYGWTAAMFWFCIVLCAMMLAAGARNGIYYSKGYDKAYAGTSTEENLFDCIWFSVITLTTVGFGDYYVPHSDFRLHEMAYIPLAILLGYICVVNFLVKCSDVIFELAKNRNIVSGQKSLRSVLSNGSNRRQAAEDSNMTLVSNTIGMSCRWRGHEEREALNSPFPLRTPSFDASLESSGRKRQVSWDEKVCRNDAGNDRTHSTEKVDVVISDDVVETNYIDQEDQGDGMADGLSAPQDSTLDIILESEGWRGTISPMKKYECFRQ